GRISSRAACCWSKSTAPRPFSPGTPTTGPDLPISAGLFAQHRRGGLYVDMRIGVPVNQFPLAVFTAKHGRHPKCKRPNLRASRHPYLAAFDVHRVSQVGCSDKGNAFRMSLIIVAGEAC